MISTSNFQYIVTWVYALFIGAIVVVIPVSAETTSDPSMLNKTKAADVLTLEEALNIAVQNNYQIKSAGEALKEAEQGRKSTAFDLFAKGHITYSYTGMKDNPYAIMEGNPDPITMSDNNLYHWDVTLIQPLFTGFALTSQYRISKLNAEVKAFEKEQKQMDVIRDVKNAYFGILLSGKILQVSKEAVASLKAHEGDAQKYFDQGVIPYNDLLRSKVALSNTIQERERATANLRMANTRFNLLLGRNVSVNQALEDIDTVPPHAFKFESIMNEALEKRPMIQAVKLGLKTLEKAIRLAQSAYYPTISLVGVYEQNGEDWEASENSFGNQHNSIIKVEAQWKVFEFGKVHADVLKTRHQLAAAREQLKTVENGVRLETENAYLNLEVAERNIRTAQESLDQARENWRITDLQYKQQVATSTDVLDARTFLSQANMNYYQSLYGYMMALGELERAVGRK